MAQLKQGVRSVAGKLSVFANGVMTSIQKDALIDVKRPSGVGLTDVDLVPLRDSRGEGQSSLDAGNQREESDTTQGQLNSANCGLGTGHPLSERTGEEKWGQHSKCAVDGRRGRAEGRGSNKGTRKLCLFEQMTEIR
ncbi:hypothetical protein HPG69_006307 [Diceros bicornis minor]|uniref:Uncharacterized protein n=1 Tax=Diceros bicornis minor TaxID=77932 RepID=A0A7J7FNF9_DICBM|nr:hypothetical protein HPG69_006307 [Diceros bicornis minor]